ncbi:hypothetical protein EHS25_005246 [Saitozyma podzolica]|uniref:Fatty acid hydroxylase domain-containing protein n=1 Tax=Saitozyma podzolica TaxID=1890683 RepID=A0A427XYU7_9TREE|nr:hypothetical protein EHS25_005246 [Saitozyma podzolica]
MDGVVSLCDDLFFDRLYSYLLPHPPVPSSLKPLLNSTYSSAYSTSATYTPSPTPPSASLWPRDHIPRQCISILLIAGLGAAALYFVFCAASYYLLYDRRLEHHPRFLKNQVRQEIASSLWAIPTIDVLTLPFFLAEVRGHSLLYTDIDQYGYAWLAVSTVLYLFWNDFGIYWIHRLEHHPRIYKYIHKPHHKWIVPTPWAALAFHPLDGYAQSLPYHVFVFICPMQKYLYLVLFVLVQVWTIFIHDGDMISGHFLERFINSPAHHTLHHLYFTCNYGQYFTWADQYFDSHRAPLPELDPIHESLRVMREKGLVDADGKPIPQKKKGE